MRSQIFSSSKHSKIRSTRLIYEIQKLLFGRVHAHRAHCITQLSRGDSARSVSVEFVEGLFQFCNLFLRHTLHVDVAFPARVERREVGYSISNEWRVSVMTPLDTVNGVIVI